MDQAVGAVFIFFFVVLLEPHAFMFFWETPVYFMLLTFRSVSFFVGAWLYTVIVKHFGAVAAVAVTTTRKLLTVIGSFVFFSSDKPFTTTYAIALGLFIAAVACEYVKHYQKHANAAKRTCRDKRGRERRDREREKIKKLDSLPYHSTRSFVHISLAITHSTQRIPRSTLPLLLLPRLLLPRLLCRSPLEFS